MKDFFSIKDTANLLGVTPQTLRNWERDGKLIPYRNPVNNYRMYKRTQVEKFLEIMSSERLRSGKFKIKIVPVGDT